MRHFTVSGLVLVKVLSRVVMSQLSISHKCHECFLAIQQWHVLSSCVLTCSVTHFRHSETLNCTRMIMVMITNTPCACKVPGSLHNIFNHVILLQFLQWTVRYKEYTWDATVPIKPCVNPSWLRLLLLFSRAFRYLVFAGHPSVTLFCYNDSCF